MYSRSHQNWENKTFLKTRGTFKEYLQERRKQVNMSLKNNSEDIYTKFIGDMMIKFWKDETKSVREKLKMFCKIIYSLINKSKYKSSEIIISRIMNAGLFKILMKNLNNVDKIVSRRCITIFLLIVKTTNKYYNEFSSNKDLLFNLRLINFTRDKYTSNLASKLLDKLN